MFFRTSRWAALLLMTALVAAGAWAQDAQWIRYPALSPDGQTIAFSYQGDIWLVPAAGGTATPMTLHAAHDTRPIWSHDGNTIAFASNRYGNFDIYSVSRSGGAPKRLTFHSASDRPSSFTPDDSAILFSSGRLDAASSVQYPTGAQPELYKVSLDGGMPKQILTTPARYASYNRAGTKIAYSDLKGYENEWRKHDDSSFARDLWMYDASSGKHTRLTEFGHDDRQPVWSADEQALYFLSERSGSFNIWKMALDGSKRIDPVTSHKQHPVRFLSSSSAGDLCYAFDGGVYLRKAGRGTSQRVAIRTPADFRTNDVQYFDVAREITEFEVSPDGKEMAFIARGEIFVTSRDHSETRRITHTAEQERSVSFGPKGRSLLYASERNGSWNLYRSDLGDDDEPSFFNATLINETPVLETDAETFQARFSPDGKEVAYLQERTELRVLNLESGKSRTIVPEELGYSYIDGDQWYQWSPDGSQFLIEFISPSRWSSEVGLVSASGDGEIVNLTQSGYEDYTPRWTMDGKAMFWFTDRFGGRLQAGWPAQFDVRLAFFTEEAWDRFQLSEVEIEQLTEREKKEKKDKKDEAKDSDKDSDGKKGKDKKSNKGDDDKKSKEDKDEIKLPDPVKVEVDGLEDRIVRLTIHSSDMADAVLTPDGETLLYLARFEKGYDLWSYQRRKQEIKLLAKLNAGRAGNLYLDKEGKKAFFLADGSLRSVEVGSGKMKGVQLSAPFELEAAAEREYLFEHVWRQTLKKFHDVDMHGVDWAFYKKRYSELLKDVRTDYDFAELLSELLGELNASHTGARYRTRMQGADSTAALGFFPDTSWDGAGIKILEIMKKSPLLKHDSKITEGAIITAIDGKKIAAGENWYPHLNRKAGQTVRLELLGTDGETKWTERVKAISLGQEGGLRYDRWVRTRREAVENLSGGRLGYSHIRGMNDGSFRVIFEEIFGKALTKQAIILDTRFNGGGNLDEALTAFLSGQEYMRAVPRGRFVGSEPSLRWTKPSIVVQNEGNYSDAHCFPNAYRTLGLGKTVGMQVPGTCTAVWWETLQNRQLVFGIPQVTWTDMDGDAMENKHFDPDYEVDNDPQLEALGRDQQLEKAVQVLLQDMPSPG